MSAEGATARTPRTIHICRLVGPGASAEGDVRDQVVQFHQEAIAATFWPRERDRLRDHLLRYARYAQLRSADEVWYDPPLTVELGRGAIARATPDILYRRGHAWRAVDIDTRAIDAPDPTMAVLSHALQREIRTACYLIAMRRKLGESVQTSVACFYTIPGIVLVHHPTKSWLDAWEVCLPALGRDVLGSDDAIRPRWHGARRVEPYLAGATPPTAVDGISSDLLSPASAATALAGER